MRPRRALTLVELMATLAIVSLLTAAAMLVVGSLTHAQVREQAQHDEALLATGLWDALTADILHADRYAVTAAGFALETQSCLDPETMEQEHLPGRVEYAVREVGPRRWLLRIQEPEGRQENGLTELVCSQVASVAIAPAETGQTAPDGDMKTGWQAMPDAVAVTVTFRGAGRPPASCVLRRK
jgi:prepilin-type N-terminal cleavage/methylation domain-containing protein